MKIVEWEYRKDTQRPSKLDLNKVNTLFLHHTSNNNGIKIDTDYQVDHNGYYGLGYNFYYDHDIDTLYVARGLEYEGAHTRGFNNHLGLAIKGNYDKESMSNEKIEKIENVIKYIFELVPTLTQIKGHKEVYNTSCPGSKFPLTHFKSLSYLTNETEELKKEIEDLKKDYKNLKLFYKRLTERVRRNNIKIRNIEKKTP